MLHKHQCGDCRHIFEHEVPDTTGMPGPLAQLFYDNGHMCPACHTGPWKDRYFANEQERSEAFREQLRGDGVPEGLIPILDSMRRQRELARS